MTNFVCHGSSRNQIYSSQISTSITEFCRISQNLSECGRILQTIAELSSSVICVCHVNFSRRLEAESAAFSVLLFGTLMQILCKIQIAKMIMIQIHSSELFLRQKSKNYVNSDQNTEYFEWNCDNNLSVLNTLKETRDLW